MPALPPDRPGCPKAPGGRRPLPDPAAIRLYLVPDTAPPYDEEIAAGAGPAREAIAGERGRGRLPAWPPRAPDPGVAAPGAGVTGSWAPEGGPPEATVPAGRVPARETPERETPERETPQRGTPGRGTPERGTPEDGNTGHGTGRREPAGTEGRDGRPARSGTRGLPRPPAAAPGTPPGWTDRFAQALAEALSGSRPPRQLVPWTTQEAMDRIQRLGPQLASAQRPLVRRVVTSRPTPDVLEMTVVVGFGPRVKAVAVRLERAGACPPARRGDQAADRWVCTAVEAA